MERVEPSPLAVVTTLASFLGAFEPLGLISAVADDHSRYSAVPIVEAMAALVIMEFVSRFSAITYARIKADLHSLTAPFSSKTPARLPRLPSHPSRSPFLLPCPCRPSSSTRRLSMSWWRSEFGLACSRKECEKDTHCYSNAGQRFGERSAKGSGPRESMGPSSCGGCIQVPEMSSLLFSSNCS